MTISSLAQRKAFLDMLAWSEGTTRIKGSENGYNVIVGGSLFSDYSDHPHKMVDLPKLGIKSSAAGRYQLLGKYWDVYKKQLNLPNFGHESQDLVALQQIRECKALDEIDAGKIVDAIHACARIWASLPGAGYGQHENKLDDLVAKFKEFGGTVI